MVCVDGVAFVGLDLSFIEPTVHAVQWYGETGEIERKGDKGVENEPIKSIEQFQQAISLWQTLKDEMDNAPPPPPPVIVVTPRQAKLALYGAGLLEQVEAAVAASDKATQITWEYAIEFRRDDPLINGLGKQMGLSDEQIDQLFITAMSL